MCQSCPALRKVKVDHVKSIYITVEHRYSLTLLNYESYKMWHL